MVHFMDIIYSYGDEFRHTFDPISRYYGKEIEGYDYKNVNVGFVYIFSVNPHMDETLFIETLLRHNFDVNKIESEEFIGGRTLLHYVCHVSHTFNRKAIELLLEHGADPNIKDNSGSTSLAILASNIKWHFPRDTKDQEEMFIRLLEHGTEVGSKADDLAILPGPGPIVGPGICRARWTFYIKGTVLQLLKESKKFDLINLCFKYLRVNLLTNVLSHVLN